MCFPILMRCVKNRKLWKFESKYLQCTFIHKPTCLHCLHTTSDCFVVLFFPFLYMCDYLWHEHQIKVNGFSILWFIFLQINNNFTVCKYICMFIFSLCYSFKGFSAHSEWKVTNTGQYWAVKSHELPGNLPSDFPYKNTSFYKNS